MVHKSNVLLILACFFTLFFILQCGKSTNPHETNGLIGQWQWVSSIGGFAGTTRTPATEGYTIVLKFDSDTTYRSTKIDTTGTVIITEVTTGAYYTAFEPVWNVSDSGDVIYMDSFIRSEFEIINDSLYLGDICIDCFGHTYVRIP